MKCLQCDVQNEDDRNFCMSCQAELFKEPHKDYKDSRILTNSTVFALSMTFILALIDVVFAFMDIRVWQKVKTGIFYESEASAISNQYLDIQLYYRVPMMILFIISFILVLTWIYRANKNSHALGAINMKYSPLGSIGWYFVPIVNFFKPYRAMKEIYQTSVSSRDWENTHVSGYIWLWWSTWVLSWVVSYKDIKAIFSKVTQSELSSAISWFIEDILTLLATIFIIIIIKTIYKYQVKNFTAKVMTK